MASTTQKFLREWKVNFRVSSAYFPHSNQRAEVGVRTAKRMLRENMSPGGSLDTNKFLRALLTHRNTPDRDTGRSPAQVIFGRPIKDFFPVRPNQFQPRAEWLLTAEQRETALAQRHAQQGQLLAEHTKVLSPLKVGDTVLVQNQTGPREKKWDKSGLVVETLEYDQYRVRMDGTGRSSLRNRRFLRPIKPYLSSILNNPDNAQLSSPNVSVSSPGPVAAPQGVQQQPGGPHDEAEQGEAQLLPTPAHCSNPGLQELRRSERIQKLNTGYQATTISNLNHN